MTKRKILVAMSGGVDSSVAAALLKEEGHDVAGATIRTWASNACADRNTKACCGLTGVEDAREVADSLGIPYWVFNFEKEFKEHVVDYFTSEYLKGRTPNPCIACNEHIKFRLFLSRARQLGYDAIATGHYARLDYNAVDDLFYLAEGLDHTKDQSYVLFPLGRDVLKHLLLPLGRYTKAEIRAKAHTLNLCVADKPDSQEICFIPSNDYAAFLKREKPELAASQAQGPIRAKEGKILGQHSGFFNYTRGQRRGLGVASSRRLYVIKTDPEKNEVVVGAREDVLSRTCEVGKVNWFINPYKDVIASSKPVCHSRPGSVIPAQAGIQSGVNSSGNPNNGSPTRLPDGGQVKAFGDDASCQIASSPSAPRNDNENLMSFRALVKIRSQHKKAPATLEWMENRPSVKVIFDEPQDAITPGQAAVFYDGPRVLGGGWIDSFE